LTCRGFVLQIKGRPKLPSPSRVARFEAKGREQKEIQEMNRPPPYFPQNQLSPPDENRYRKFKLIMAGIAFILVLIVAGLAYGIYLLISTLF